MRLGLGTKIVRAFRRGLLIRKSVPYLWYYLGPAFVVRLWCRLRPARRDKIVLYNFRGLGFGDHQKYIVLELLRRKTPLEIVWLAVDPETVRREVPPGVRVAPYAPLSAIRELASARFWCVNQSMTAFIFWGLAKKRSQCYVQTYHGSLGIKRIGADSFGDGTVRLWERVLRRDAAMIDYLIANATWEAETVYRTRFFGCGQPMLFGHPRNDVFFSDQSETRRRVRESFGIGPDERILFYAPTHRHNRRRDVIVQDLAALKAACERRFGGRWRAMVRLHPNMVGYARGVDFGAETVDATRYPDMQELLIASDVLLSDYSSCMFDFMLTRRPVFVYAPDIEEYQRVQGFYYPMSETPFPVAHTESDILDNIEQFDESVYRDRVEAFLREKGCCDDGHATERVVDLIERLLQRRRTGGGQ